jgi:hypothetical protein
LTDLVEIAGIRFTGQGGKLPRWATEKSIDDLTDEVKKLIKITLKATGQNASSSEFVKQNKKLIQSLDELDGELDSVATRASKLGDSLESNAKKTRQAANDIDSGMKSSKKSLLSLDEPTKKVGGMMSRITSGTGLVIGKFALMGITLRQILPFITANVDAFNALYNTGITFEKDLVGLRLATREAALPLGTFTKILQESSAVVKTFGNNGAFAFASVVRQTNELIRSQGYYGLTMEALAEQTSQIMDLQRLQGIMENQNTFKSAQTQADFLKNLTLYSQIMGKSREQILNEMKQIGTREDVAAIFMALPEQLRKTAFESLNAMTGSLASVFGDKSAEVANLFTDMISKDFTFQSEFIQALTLADAQLGRNVENFAQRMKRGEVTADEARIFVADFAAKLKKLGPAGQEVLKRLSATDSTLKSGAQQIVGMQMQLLNMSHEQIQQLKDGIPQTGDTDSPSAVAIRIQNEFNQRWSDIELLFMESFNSVIPILSTGFSKLFDNMKNIFKTSTKFVASLFDKNSRDELIAQSKKVLDRLIATLSSWADKIFEYLNEKFNPFHRSSEQRESQEKMAGLLKDETVTQTSTPQQDVYVRALQDALSQDDFVKDFDSNFAYQKLIEQVAKNTDLNLTKILHPAILASDKFRDTFDKIMSNQMPWQTQQAEFEKLGVQSPLDFEIEQLRKQGKWMLPAEKLAGPGPNNLRRNMNLTPEMAATPLVAAPVNPNQQDATAMAQTLGRLVEATERSNQHLEQIVIEQKRTVGTNRQINRSIEQNSNELR